MKGLLLQTDEWYRRRLRMVIWQRGRTKLRNLIKLGINKYKAWEYANNRKGYWRRANSPILTRTVTNERLKQAGYIFLSDYYRKVKVVCKLRNRRIPNGTYGGVRGQVGNLSLTPYSICTFLF